jgi:hypothetical protein
VNGFIGYLYTRLGSTSNYSATAYHNHKSPQHLLRIFPACCAFTSRSLAKTSNIEDSSASHAQVLSSQSPVQNSTELCPLLITFRYGTLRKHSSSIFSSNCCIIKNLVPSNGNVFTEPLPRNGRCLQSHRLVKGL